MRHFLQNLLFLFFLCGAARAAVFEFVYPEGDGDSVTARPFLDIFFEGLKNATNIEFSGDYLDSESAATGLLDKGGVDVAIVPSGFFDAWQGKYGLKKIAVTIPIYASGPYEKYYVLATLDLDLGAHALAKSPVKIIATHEIKMEDLRAKIFSGEPTLSAINWMLQREEDLQASLKKISSGELRGVALLSGYEYFALKEIIKMRPDFMNLRLIVTSPELPSPVVVITGKSSLDASQTAALKKALLVLGNSVTGKVMLRNLRLKGFADVP